MKPTNPNVKQFRVEGDPKGQPRPRAFAFKGKARMYDAGTAEGWKGLVALAAKEHRPAAPFEGPIKLEIEFYIRRPGTLLRKSSPVGNIYHAKKPDADNLAKAVMDALNPLGFWNDDSQVQSLLATKFYTAKGEMPGAFIYIEAL